MEDEEGGLVVPVQELDVQNVLHAVVRDNLHKRMFFSSYVGPVHLDPWIRIQGYEMKGKAEFNQQKSGFFFAGNYIFQDYVS